MPLVKAKQVSDTAETFRDRRVQKIFEKLEKESGRLNKQAILDANRDDNLFTRCLQFLLNPYITTGLSDKKISKSVSCHVVSSFSTLEQLLDYVSENNTGTDEVIATVHRFMNDRPADLMPFYRGLVTKSIKLGLGAATVNPIYWSGFIPKFEVMLAEKYFDSPERVSGKEFTVTLKLDGIRCIAIKEEGKVTFFSRQGQEILGLVEIEKELIRCSEDDFVLDGELLVEGAGSSADQYKVTTQVVRKDGDKTGVTFYVFDVMNIDEFSNQSCPTPYSERRTRLETGFKYMNWVTPLPALYRGADTERITKLLDLVRKQDKEGVMININDAPYEFKRTFNLLKVKAMQDVDLKIIGFEEGSGRLSGTLGRINVDYKGNTVGVGSGFSDEQRQWFWQNKENLLGRIISVQYFEETKSDNGLSLRFPVFKELREEGKEVSYA